MSVKINGLKDNTNYTCVTDIKMGCWVGELSNGTRLLIIKGEYPEFTAGYDLTGPDEGIVRFWNLKKHPHDLTMIYNLKPAEINEVSILPDKYKKADEDDSDNEIYF